VGVFYSSSNDFQEGVCVVASRSQAAVGALQPAADKKRSVVARDSAYYLTGNLPWKVRPMMPSWSKNPKLNLR